MANKTIFKVKKTRFVLAKIILIALVAFSAAISGRFALAQEEGYAWVLVNEVDDRGVKDLDQLKAKLKVYEKSGVRSEVSSSLNNTGYYVDYSAHTLITGQGSSAQATISTPPLEIKPDTPVELNLRISMVENDSGKTGATARVVFCSENSTSQQYAPPTLGGKPFYLNQFKSEAGKDSFDLNSVDGYEPYDTTVSGLLPAGTKHGEGVAVCAEAFLAGIRMGTVYTYRWLPTGSGEVTGINKKYEVPKDENGDYIDSGVKVSDIGGEVYVRHGDANSLDWELLNVGDVVYEGDIIHTKERNSHCSLSLTDLTTFDMRPRSGLIINTMSEKESKLKLLAGKVLMNVKKMLKDGSMSVEMSQAVAGIKGTILILETDDTVSSVKVLEGQVEVKDNDGNLTMVNPNEKITIADGQEGKKEAYALKDELSSWEEETRSRIISDIKERTGQEPDLETVPAPDSSGAAAESVSAAPNEKERSSSLYLWVIGIIILAGIGFWLKKRKSN